MSASICERIPTHARAEAVFEQQGWVAMYGGLRDAAKQVGINHVGERTSLLWKLGEKKGEGQTYS